MKVYKRTSEGQWAAFDEHSPLPRKLKILLKAINGKVAEDIYVQNLGSFGDVRALLSSLEQVGLIADRGPRARTPPSAVAPASELAGAAVMQAAAAAAAPALLPELTPAPAPAPAPEPTPVAAQTEAAPRLNAAGQRRPSPVLWQTLPELTDVSDAVPAAPPASPHSTAVAALTTSPPVHVAPTVASQAPARRPDAARAPPVLTEVHAASDASRLTQMDAMAALADLAELAGQSAGAAHTAQASNILTHNALLAANDEPESGQMSKRAAVRHAVELMSNFVLEHMPRTASQVLPEIESLHSVEQWAELMDGYAMFVAPTGERGHIHMAQLRRMLAAAFDASDLSPKGWYA
jgi:hypothetical protein